MRYIGFKTFNWAPFTAAYMVRLAQTAWPAPRFVRYVSLKPYSCPLWLRKCRPKRFSLPRLSAVSACFWRSSGLKPPGSLVGYVVCRFKAFSRPPACILCLAFSSKARQALSCTALVLLLGRLFIRPPVFCGTPGSSRPAGCPIFRGVLVPTCPAGRVVLQRD